MSLISVTESRNNLEESLQKANKFRLFAQKLLNDPRYKKAQKIAWVICIVWAGVIVTQSIPYYTFIGQGKQAFLEGRYGEAEELFKSSVKESQGYDHSDPRYANALNNLGELYRKQAKFSQAEPIYVELLDIAENKLQKKRQEAAVLVNNVAAFYRDKGDYPRSEKLYQKALGIWESDVKKLSDQNYAAIISGMAKLYKDEGRYPEAEKLYLKALAIYEKLNDKKNPGMAAVETNLGSLYREQKRYKDSMAMYTRALDRDVSNYGWMHADVATDENNLAGLNRDRGRLKEAEEQYQSALKKRRVLLGNVHPHTAKSLLGLGELRHAQGNLPEAEQLMKQALLIDIQSYGTEMHPDCASCFNSLAEVYRKNGKLHDAKVAISKAVKIRKAMLPATHPDLAASLQEEKRLSENIKP